MLTVFVCFAAADRAVGEAIAVRLEATTEVRAVQDEIPDQTLPTAWECGTASGGVIMLLSPASVPVRLSRDDWADVLRHNEAHTEPPITSVLVKPCRYPSLLERNRFLRWDESGVTLRALQRSVMSLHPVDSGGLAPALQPYFAGRETELEQLRASLIDQPGLVLITGAPGSGSTSLAQEFARQSQEYFRKVIWVSCRGRALPSVLGDLAAQLGLRSPQSQLDSIARLFHQHRLLAVFDELEHEDLLDRLGGGAASVLVTRRSPIVGVQSLKVEPPPLASLGVPDSVDEQALWEAMTVCRADQVPLDLAAAIANIPADRASDACRGLTEKRLADPLDAVSATYRLNRPALMHGRDQELRRRHAQLTGLWFNSSLAEAETALSWACEADWNIAVRFGKQLFTYLRAQGRTDENVLVLKKLEAAAEQRRDSATLEFARNELSWISGSPWTRGVAANAQQLQFDFAVSVDGRPL
jgi:hypothetical protein